MKNFLIPERSIESTAITGIPEILKPILKNRLANVDFVHLLVFLCLFPSYIFKHVSVVEEIVFTKSIDTNSSISTILVHAPTF